MKTSRVGVDITNRLFLSIALEKHKKPEKIMNIVAALDSDIRQEAVIYELKDSLLLRADNYKHDMDYYELASSMLVVLEYFMPEHEFDSWFSHNRERIGI